MQRSTGHVVVGFHDSTSAEAALHHALEEADRRGAVLRVVTVCPPPPARSGDGLGDAAPDPAAVRDAMARVVRRRVAELRRLVPAAAGVEVEVLAVTGSPVEELVAAARDADLLVVGHRGPGARCRAPLGAVGLGVVVRAPCPTTVVPEPPAVRGEARTPAYETTPVPLPVGPIA